jgi:cytochrome c-type biogenesis protein CcmE
MSRLDEELARAVEESEGDAPAATQDVHPQQPDSPARRPKKGLKNVGLVIALVVMASGILALVLTTAPDAAVYSKGVDEVLAEKDRLGNRNIRVAGVLVKGSLKHRDDPCEYLFKIMKNDAVLDVRYPQCIVPDTFRDRPEVDVEVTAEGKLGESGTFEATQIMAKCPSKYEMKESAASGAQSPHDTLPTSARPTK